MEDKKLENFSSKVIQGVGSIGSLIVHTILFMVFFVLFLFGIEIDKILLILTTIVSLEAIIFIQMSVNIQTKKLNSVASDVEDIQKDVEEIQENVEEIQENVEEIQENVEEIQENTEDENEK